MFKQYPLPLSIAGFTLFLSAACSSTDASTTAGAGGSGGDSDYGEPGGSSTHGGSDPEGGSAGSSTTTGAAGCHDNSCAATGVSVAGDFACAVMRDGRVQCWGGAFGGGLGRGEGPTGTFSAAPVVGLSTATGIAVNAQGSCALLKQGTVSCWGNGSISGYGTGTLMESETPADVMVAHATALTRGLSSLCALLEGGTAKCWQDLTAVAPDAPIPALRPTLVPSVEGAKEIAQGAAHLCMLKPDGTVQCVGSNEHSQLGTGKIYNDLEQSTVMVPVKGLSNVTHLSAGDDFTCALIDDGSVSCWGDIPGQAGPFNADGYPTPVAVPGLSTVTALSATASAHACALLRSGNVACWGENSHFESGATTPDTVIMPATVQGVTNATSVSIGDDVSCAVDKDGRVLCWGDDLIAGPAHAEAQAIPFGQ